VRHSSFPLGPILIALAVGGGLLIVPGTVAASDGGSLGITLSFSIGARPAFGIGVDLRYSHYIAIDPDASRIDHGVVGAFFQATYLRGGAIRYSLGGHGGVLPASTLFNLDGEAGITFLQSIENNGPSGVGIHLGILPLASLIFAEHGPSIRGSIGLSKDLKSELILGWDIRAPGPCIFNSCTYFFGSGRPLRPTQGASPVHASLMLRPKRAHASGARSEIDVSTRACLGAHWLRETSAECASIPSFLALARDLALIGAPSALVAHAKRAADEEATHTRLCAALAAEYTGFDVAALTPDVPGLFEKERQALLKRLALESFWDGCVGEGAAAAQARRMAVHAGNARTREVLSMVARDEQAHAELAKNILSFCLSSGGRPVRDALVLSIEESLFSGEDSLSQRGKPSEHADTEMLWAYGCADDRIARVAREEALESSFQIFGMTLREAARRHRVRRSNHTLT